MKFSILKICTNQNVRDLIAIEMLFLSPDINSATISV